MATKRKTADRPQLAEEWLISFDGDIDETIIYSSYQHALDVALELATTDDADVSTVKFYKLEKAMTVQKSLVEE